METGKVVQQKQSKTIKGGRLVGLKQRSENKI